MSAYDMGFLTLLAVACTFYLADCLNSLTAAVRELLAVVRKKAAALASDWQAQLDTKSVRYSPFRRHRQRGS